MYKVDLRIRVQIRIRIRETKEKICTRISEIRARILKEESNLCTKLNKPTQLHQDRHSKTSSFEKYMVSF